MPLRCRGCILKRCWFNALVLSGTLRQGHGFCSHPLDSCSVRSQPRGPLALWCRGAVRAFSHSAPGTLQQYVLALVHTHAYIHTHNLTSRCRNQPVRASTPLQLAAVCHELHSLPPSATPPSAPRRRARKLTHFLRAWRHAPRARRQRRIHATTHTMNNRIDSKTPKIGN